MDKKRKSEDNTDDLKDKSGVRAYPDKNERDEGYESDEIIEIGSDVEEKESKPKEVFIPGINKLEKNEVLNPDLTAYDMIHIINVKWPCLTLDIMLDNLGYERRSYPLTMYVVTATQADKSTNNELSMIKFSSLYKTIDKSEFSDDSESEECQSKPAIAEKIIPFDSTTNRLRVSGITNGEQEYLTGVMSESGDLLIYDLGPFYRSANDQSCEPPSVLKMSLYKSHVHKIEGYGLDWSPMITSGALLSGDVSGKVFLTKRTSANWITEKTPYCENSSSIEDIQWSQSEQTVFATGACDGHVRIWDIRSKQHKSVLSVNASNLHVNVLSWNKKMDYLLSSGHDDGSWSVWDLRYLKSDPDSALVTNYSFHKSPITSISFSPLDESIISVSSEDSTVSLWDLSVEPDNDENFDLKKDIPGLPPQILFIHYQKNVKDVRWHPQIPGCLISTGSEGLNIWKTISI